MPRPWFFFCAGVLTRRSFSPSRGLVVLEEFAQAVGTGQKPREHRVANSRRAVNDVERRLKIKLLLFPVGMKYWVLVGDPAGVHGVDEYPIFGVIRGGSKRQHVESGLGHVGVGVLVGFSAAREAPLHGGDIDDVLLVRAL